jgi:YesN/AraC family two-component response regulator
LLATDGTAAMRIAQEEPEIRLIMLDVVMPGLSGQKLAEQLQALHPAATTLFCSGHFPPELLRLGIDLKGAHFLQKPCRPLELKERLAEIFASR